MEILEVGEPNSALEAGLHFANVVLETSQRGQRPLPDHHAVAQEADLRPTGEYPVAHVATCHSTHSRDPEDLADLGLAGDDLLEFRSEHSEHGCLDVLEELVDDLVGADLHVSVGRHLAGPAVRTNI